MLPLRRAGNLVDAEVAALQLVALVHVHVSFARSLAHLGQAWQNVLAVDVICSGFYHRRTSSLR